MDEQDYYTNSYEVRNAKDARAKARHAKTLMAKRTKAQRKLDRWLEANGYTASDMWSWLSRYGHYAGHGQTKEERSAIGKRAFAIGQIKMRYCRHDKKAPKLRRTGKHAGLWVCPSCHTPVPAPEKEEEDLVL